MGTFMGHAIPGTFFMFFGIWWTIRISHRYYVAKFQKGGKYRSTLSFSLPTRCCGDWQFEGYLKLIFSSIGIIGEIITGVEGGKFTHIGNGQHATMFFFFGFSGLVDILIHHKVLLPNNSDYLITVMATFVEGLLFKFHLHGRNDLDVQIHTLLVYTVFITCIILVAEMSWPYNVLLTYGRAFLTLLQGTWFYQLAFILYNPFPGSTSWDPENHTQIMITTIIFAWHMMAIFIFILLVAVLTSCYIRRRFSKGLYHHPDQEILMERLISKDQNGHTMIRLTHDSESDVEFERPAPSMKS